MGNKPPLIAAAADAVKFFSAVIRVLALLGRAVAKLLGFPLHCVLFSQIADIKFVTCSVTTEVRSSRIERSPF